MLKVTVTWTRASNRCVSRSSCVFLAAILLFPLRAQEPESSTTIRANVPLVLAPVTVTDKKGNFIDGLKAEDFRLTDEGVPQQIRMDTSDTVQAPVSLMVLIQASGISAPVLARTQQVGGMIKPLVVGDRGQAAVIEFDDEIRVRTDFTADSSVIRTAFEGTRSRSIRTARLIDAVVEGVKMLDTRPPNNRRVMLILSESRDRGSKSQAQRSHRTRAARGRHGVPSNLFGAGFHVCLQTRRQSADAGRRQQRGPARRRNRIGANRESQRGRGIGALYRRTPFGFPYARVAGESDLTRRRRNSQPISTELHAHVEHEGRIPPDSGGDSFASRRSDPSASWVLAAEIIRGSRFN